MDTTTPTKASPADAGCWIDGHWGQYGPRRLIEIAVINGMPLEGDDLAAFEAHHVDQETFADSSGAEQDTFEWVIGQGGLADSAEEWLNEHIAPEGFSFGWWEGNFMLQSTEWWEEG